MQNVLKSTKLPIAIVLKDIRNSINIVRKKFLNQCKFVKVLNFSHFHTTCSCSSKKALKLLFQCVKNKQTKMCIEQ